MDLPDNVSTGTVTARYIVKVADGQDPNQEPDALPAHGRIVFTASVPYLPDPTASPDPVTIMTAPIVAVLDDEGYLCTPFVGTVEPAYRGIKLAATDDPDLAVQNWTWDVTYIFEPVNGHKLAIPAHGFALPSGETVDLTKVAKVPSSPGYSLPQAEAAVLRAEAIAQSIRDDADNGVFNGEAATLEVGTVTSGTTAEVVNVGDEQHAILNITLEKGAKGDTGDGIPDGGEPLQVVRRTPDGATTEWADVDKNLVGLSNVDNTSDTDKPVSSATQSALNLKASTSDLTAGLSGKADLQSGKVPVSQLPTDALVTDANVAAQVNGAQTGLAIDARINTQVTPQVEQIASDYIASQPAVVDAAAAAVDANPTILAIEGRELPDRGRATLAAFPAGVEGMTVKGSYGVWIAADATALGLPYPAAGRLNIFPIGNVTMYQYKATTSEGTLTFENWKAGTGGLGAWTEPRNTGYESRFSALEASTTRVAAVTLSTGDSGGIDTATSRNFRYPIKIATTGHRFRVHVQNANPRYGNRLTGALSFTGLGIAKHAGATDPALEGQFSGAVTSIDQGFTTNAFGFEYVSPWVENDPIKGYTEYLLTGGYTCAAQNNFAGVGGGWMTANASDWNVATPVGLTVSNKLPLYVWIEIEVDADVPVGAWFGDSLASGVSARLGVFDSAPNRHALANGYIPTLYTNSGIKMADHTDPAHFRWIRYDTATGLSKPDFLVWEMGSNDVFTTGTTLANLQATFDTVWKIAASKLSPNMALMTILPRFDAVHTQEAVRKAWNEYLLTTLPGRAVVAIDAAGPLTNPDGSTLDTKYIAAPGDIHLSAAGYARFIKDLPSMN